MSILRHVDAETEERDAYLRMSAARRRAASGNGEEAICAPEEVENLLSAERFDELEALEEFILSVAEDGLGKRSSALRLPNYRARRQGHRQYGSGAQRRRDGVGRGRVPVRDSDEIMLITDAGQLIRCPVDGIRIAGRRTQGVTLFRVAESERVVSVTRLGEDDESVAEEETPNGGDNDGGGADG